VFGSYSGFRELVVWCSAGQGIVGLVIQDFEANSRSLEESAQISTAL